jgi:hypothetical protein
VEETKEDERTRRRRDERTNEKQRMKGDGESEKKYK